MADYDRRQSGGGNNSRKRRYRDDDDYDRRGSRRRIDNTPLPGRIRRQLLSLAESPLRRWHEEVQAIASAVATNYDNQDIRNTFLNLTLQIAIEQPLKTPFVAGVILLINGLKPEVVDDVLAKAAAATEEKIQAGEWREVKLYLKLLACLQGCLSDDGVFPLLEELFSRAVDLQTASSDDTIGTELVKIILLTIPYILSSSSGDWQEKAAGLMDKTEVIAGEPHVMQALIDPYVPEDSEENTPPSMSIIGLLQKQLQAEATSGWKLTCLPRPWNMPMEEVEATDRLENAPKHALPSIKVPETVVAGRRPLFPEVFFSVFTGQDVESTPPPSDIAASLIRDGLLDTINALDFNRNVTAKFLIDIDCFFAEGTFVKRATPFDRLKDGEPGKSTWKPEDVAVDTVFSQIFQLPAPEHKVVYYHSVLTEACKLAPAAIAPSLGRAIRYLYHSTSRMDLELSHRFVTWFSHHLSNFGFTWKWTEWEEDVLLADIHPRKSFMLGAIDKEIRLSFPRRIKGTLPPAYQDLIGPDMEKDAPDFKYNDAATPFAAEGKEIEKLLRTKAADDEFQPVIERIHTAALDLALDPLVASTDVFMTTVCAVGSKSLSHILTYIDRTKGRLLDVGAASEAARAQIISSVMAYWRDHPGVAVSIVEKLLNYSILTPLAVVDWVLAGGTSAAAAAADNDNDTNGQTHDSGAARPGEPLGQAHMFEMVLHTIGKVTGHVRQVVAAAMPAPVEDEDASTAAAAAAALEIKGMRDLFRTMDDALVSWATGTKDELMESPDMDSERAAMLRRWGQRWQRVFRRKAAIEEAFLVEASKSSKVSSDEDIS